MLWDLESTETDVSRISVSVSASNNTYTKTGQATQLRLMGEHSTVLRAFPTCSWRARFINIQGGALQN